MEKDSDRRRYIRFGVPLKVEVEGKSLSGTINNFSREGFKATFDEFPFDTNSQVNFQVQRPNKDIFVYGSGEVVWKSNLAQSWEVGIRLKNFAPEFKVEILDHAYEMWVKEKMAHQA